MARKREITRKRLVFVSHSSRDTWVAKQIAREITACGAVPFHDEADIETGAEFCVASYTRYDPAPKLFFEIEAAMGMRKRLIPVVSREVDLAALPPSLRERRYLIKGSPEATAQEFVSEAIVPQPA